MSGRRDVDRGKQGLDATRRWVTVALSVAVALIASKAAAVDGVSVTTHWVGKYNIFFGGIGQIWRHDIEDGAVVAHELLYSDPALPARNPVISPDGSRVAFLRADGAICTVPIGGGEITVLEGATSHPQAFLDWPSGNWIYYTQGGFLQPSGSRILRRIDAVTGIDELVTQFVKDDGLTAAGTWRVQISSNLRRAVVRTDDAEPEPFGRIVAYDLAVNDGILRLDRATDRFSCNEGIEPSGVLFMDGEDDHQGFEMRRFDDLEVIAKVRWKDAEQWGPDLRPAGLVHHLNTWSVNSSRWLVIGIGWTDKLIEHQNRPARGSNQMLINWVDEERIVITENLPDTGKYDDAGDFWVDGPDPDDTTVPEVVAVSAPSAASPMRVTFSEPVNQASAEVASNYRIEPGVTVLSARLSDDSMTVELGCDGLVAGVAYELFVSNVKDRSEIGNTVSGESPFSFLLAEEELALVVEAGPDGETPVGYDYFLAGSISPGSAGELAVDWTLREGPAQAVFADPHAASTYVRFEVEGTYVLELSVSDGVDSAVDEATVVVTPGPSIRILRPAGGERFVQGATELIRFETTSVDDVRIDYSCDRGATWKNAVTTVDTTSPQWGGYPWTVPVCETDSAVLRLSEYTGTTSTDSMPFAIVPLSSPGKAIPEGVGGIEGGPGCGATPKENRSTVPSPLALFAFLVVPR